MAENGAFEKRSPKSSDRPSARREGIPCWVDAQLSDVEAGRRFYGELFGWTFQEEAAGESEESPYRAPTESVRACLDGEPVAALVRKTDGRMPTVWSVYFHTPDAAALAARIRAGGGQVLTPPHPVGDLGTAALAADPDGAVFGLWQPGRRTGFGRRHEPGTFAWAELYTRDTEAANAFYGDLFHDALFGADASPDFGPRPGLGRLPRRDAAALPRPLPGRGRGRRPRRGDPARRAGAGAALRGVVRAGGGGVGRPGSVVRAAATLNGPGGDLPRVLCPESG
ncbi:putative enzyme related to lactoylglutathione lyase [Streptomyces ambofaciens]